MDDSGAQQAAGLPSFNSVAAAAGLATGGAKDGGLAWSDWNGDGCPDLLVNSSDAIVASRLYLQSKGSTCTGSFSDVTSCLAAGLLTTPRDRSVVWGDLNQDGRPDFVRNDNLALEVYLNNGPGTTAGGGCPAAGVAWSRFGNPATGNPSQVIDGAVIPGFNMEGLGFIDYDADGDLDLVADNATNGISMLRNNGAGALTLVTGIGLPDASAVNGDYLAVGDFDVDGDVDLIARRNDGATVWVNTGGSFALNPNSPEVALNANKGGVAMCDLDNDGDLDFVWTDSLNGIAGSAGAEAWRNNGEGGTSATWTNFPLTFVPAPSGGQNVDGVSCGDYDNDGDLDLAFTSGLDDYLFRNDGGFVFVNVTPAGFGATDGEGNAFSDYDRDGDLDLAVNQATANELWRNETGGNNYLMVRALHDVDGAGPGTVTRDAIGATISLRSCSGTPLTGVREVSGGSGMGSQGPLPVHFGLPSAGIPRGPGGAYVVRVQFVGGAVRQKAVVPLGLGCYQEVAIRDTDANDLSVCVANAVELQSFTARGCDGGVELRWQTGSELDNLGFHVQRAARPGGPYARVTPALVPGLGSSPIGRGYAWLDRGLANGTSYHYRLEDVDTSASSRYHGPVAATPRAGEACEASAEAAASSPRPAAGRDGSPSRACPAFVLAALGEASGAPAECTRHGDPDAVALRTLARDTRGATLELRTEGFWAVHEGSGGVRVFVPGFEWPEQDALAPALPLRRALVDAVVGRQVRLVSVQATGRRGFPGLRPSAIGVPEMAVARDGTVRAERRAPSTRAAARRTPAAPTWARLAGTAFQGLSKTAIVELAPLRFDERAQQLILARRLVLRLSFAGRDTDEAGAGSRGRRRPRRQADDAAEVLARLHTAERGLHAVALAGLIPRSSRGVAATELELRRRGAPVAFHVEPATGELGPTSTLYFHVDETPASTQYAPELAFELVRTPHGGPMATVAAPPSGPEQRASPSTVADFEANRIYQPGLLEAPDVWLWEALTPGVERSVAFSLPAVDRAATAAAELRVVLQGGSESGAASDHHVRVRLNGEVVGAARFAGKKRHELQLAVPASSLLEGSNALTLENVGDTGVPSLVFLDKLSVSYPRLPRAVGGRFEATWSEDGTVRVDGVGSTALVVDATGRRWVDGFEPGPGFVRFGALAGRRYLVVSREGLLVPRATPASPSTLRDAGHAADYVVIAPRAFRAAADALVALREGQGLEAMAVAFEEITDAFGHGQPSAEAIREFVRHAFHRWRRGPRYVLLLGDASYDPQRRLAASAPAPLPALFARTTYLWTAADPLLGAVNGEDAFPDLAIGRLPAASPEQAQALVDKLAAWEAAGRTLAGRALLVADDPDAGGDFEADVEDVRASFLAGRATTTLKLRELGVAATRQGVRDALDAGAGLASYVGHGGAAVWASENVWNSWDAASLQAQSEQPLLLTLNCLNGYFVAPSFDSLSESLLKAEGRGAIAAFSPSGLSVAGPAHQYHRALLAELVSGRHERLGDAVLAAQAAYAATGLMPELVSVYHLLGDPATPIR